MLEEILAPVPSSLVESHREEGSDRIGSWIEVHDELAGMPDWEEAHLCILGVCEDRGRVGAAEQAMAIDSIRRELYDLYPGDWPFRVVDLGTLYAGEQREDTYAALKEILVELFKFKVLPLVIGGSQDLTYAMYRAYDLPDQTVNIAAVDSRFDLGRQSEMPLNEFNYLSHIILKKPYRLFNFASLGYQTCFIHQEEKTLMEKMHFDLIRLGRLRADVGLCEPYLRDSDLVSMDLSSVKASGGVEVAHPGPNGFSEDEICSLSRYSGISDKVSSFGLFGMACSEGSKNRITPMLAAQVLWYFMEGYAARTGEYPASKIRSYGRFSVLMNDGEQELIFYKSPVSGRWWMEVPVQARPDGRSAMEVLVPFTQEDYDKACADEIPDRWWGAYRKGL